MWNPFKKKKAQTATGIFSARTFKECLEYSLGAACARQLALGDHLGDRNPKLEITNGCILFGDDIRYQVQILGSESYVTNTWMWAWNNSESDFPTSLLECASKIRNFGTQQGILEMTEGYYKLDRISGDMQAIVGSELCGERCYFRWSHENGALFFLLMDTPPSLWEPVHPFRASTVVSEVLSGFEVRHRPMITAFLKAQKAQVQITDVNSELTGTLCDGSRFSIHFDEHGRIDYYNFGAGPPNIEG